MPPPESFSRADVDQAVSKAVTKALKEQANTLTLDGLKAELTKVWTAINDANHFKAEFGQQFNDLNLMVRAHIQLAMHPGTAEEFEQRDLRQAQMLEAFGVDQLTPEQKAMTPLIVRSYAATRALKEESTQRADHFWQRIALAATGLLTVVAIADGLGLFAFVRIHVFHLPN